MARDLYSEEVMICYLLKELPPDVEAEVDKKIFVDTDYFTRLLEVEEQLAEDYSRGRLSANLRRRFKRNYAKSLDRVLKAETQRSLSRPSPSGRGPEPRWRLFKLFPPGPKLFARVVFASVVIALIAGVLFFVSGGRRDELAADNRVNRTGDQSIVPQPSAEASPIQGTSDDRTRPGPSDQDLPPSNKTPPERERQTGRAPVTSRAAPGVKTGPPRTLPGVAAATPLLPGALRGDKDFTPVEIPPDAASVSVKIQLGAKIYPTYRVVLKTRDDQELWSRPGIKPRREGRRAYIVLHIPTEHLTQKYYRLHLYRGATPDGGLDIDYYPFEVRKK